MIYNDGLKSAYDLFGATSLPTTPASDKPAPSQPAYEAGYITRRFAKKLNDSTLFEVGQSVIPPETSALYTIVSLKWKISGPLQDKRDGNLIQETGILNYNRSEIQRVLAETDVDLSNILTNLSEYWRGY